MKKDLRERNDEIAYRKIALGQTYAELEDIFGISRQRIAQILKGRDPNLAVHLCACGRDIYTPRHGKCRSCRRGRTPKERPACRYCDQPGGYEIPACTKHRWRWYYHHAPNHEERKKKIVALNRSRQIS